MLIIQSLDQTITPQVLQDAQIVGDDNAKRSALSRLHQLLALTLTSPAALKRAETYLSANPQGDGDGLLAALLSEENQNVDTQQIYDGIAKNHDLPSNSVRMLALSGLPLAYQHIKEKAGAAPVDGFLASERQALLATLPAWLIALLPKSLATAATAATEKPAPAYVDLKAVEEPKKSNFTKTLLPIVGLIILAALALALIKACQKEPTSIAVPTLDAPHLAPALAPASLAVSLDETGEALYACDGVVGNEALAAQAIFQIQSASLDAGGCEIATFAKTANDMPTQPYIAQVLGFMKGAPNAYALFSGKTVTLNATDDAALGVLVQKIRQALPDDFDVQTEEPLNEEQAVASAIGASMSALETMTDSATIDDLIYALNLQIINFAVDSTEIPQVNQEILNKAAARLKELPDAHLLIIGHTDNSGALEYNQDLSERRAKAVRDYLVAQGVDDAKLDHQGASFTRPIASNATEQGRFKNRRIAFKLRNHGEQVATVATAADAVVDDAKAVDDSKDGTLSGAVGALEGAAQATNDAIGSVLDSAANALENAAQNAEHKNAQ